MKRFAALAYAISAAGLLVVGSILVGPVWQIHDDVYYAMFGGGYGLVAAPVDEIPYIHPAFGAGVGAFRWLAGGFAYAAVLYVCLALVLIVLYFRHFQGPRDVPGAGLIALGLAPALLLPQYSTVSALLVAATLVLWLGGRQRSPRAHEWVLGSLLLAAAAFLRLEMAVLAGLCLLPLVLWQARDRGDPVRLSAAGAGGGLMLSAALFALGALWFGETRMAGFYDLNGPMAKVTNYGYPVAFERAGMPLPDGMTRNDLALLKQWFFGYLPLVEPAKMAALADSVPVVELLRVRYWTLLDTLRSLPSSLYFWVGLAGVILTWSSHLRLGLLAAYGVFVAADLASAALAKPFPERVALGIMIGLFVVAVLTPRKEVSAARLGRWLAAALLLPPLYNIGVDRLAVERELVQLRTDARALAEEKRLYVFVGAFPLRAAFRPFQIEPGLHQFVFLGTMYLVPAVQDGEQATGCGGFAHCLASGRSLAVIGDDEEVHLLDGLMREHFGKTLVVEEERRLPSFALWHLSARDLRGGDGP